MYCKIKIRKNTASDLFQTKIILDKCFGTSRFNRTVYLYRKKPPISELSLISYFAENPDKVVGTISFYRVIIETIHCILLGPLAVDQKHQGKGFGKKLVEIGLKLAKSNNEKICFVSGEYNYYKEFGFEKINKKKLNIITPGPLSYDSLLICGLKNSAINLPEKEIKLLPLS